MHESADLHRVIGALHQARASLDLDTAHLCYLITLRVRAERGNLASLPDGLLRLRTPLMRCTDPVRGLADPTQALVEGVPASSQLNGRQSCPGAGGSGSGGAIEIIFCMAKQRWRLEAGTHDVLV